MEAKEPERKGRAETAAVVHNQEAPDPSGWQVDIAAMAGSLVHEIKNPLSTLKLNTELLIEDWRNATGPREVRTVRRLHTMLAELKRLEDVIHSFLSFTQRHELRLEPTSVNDLLEHIIDLVGEASKRRGIQVRKSLDPGVPEILLDPSLMQQAFMNLVTNAQEAMPDGGELIIKSRADGDWIVVDVIDTGTGIPTHQIERIFDLYFSTKEGGNGLGLARCRRIVQEHGGTIEVKSEVGRGSQFTVKLPVRRELPDSQEV